MKKITFLIVTLAVTTLALGGCFRKSIESAPPAKRPAAQNDAGPAAKPGIISETHTVDGNGQPVIEGTHDNTTSGPEIIDESYDVQPGGEGEIIEEEAAVVETKRPDIGGEDLAEDPMPGPQPAVEETVEKTEEVVVETTEQAANDPVAKEAFEPVSDPENEVVMDEAEAAEEMAEAVSKTVGAAETGDYYVQVGAFSDLENANKVLAGLLSDGYKGSMLVKTDTGMYRVRAGAFADTESATKALEALKGQYPNGYVLKGE